MDIWTWMDKHEIAVVVLGFPLSIAVLLIVATVCLQFVNVSYSHDKSGRTVKFF